LLRRRLWAIPEGVLLLQAHQQPLQLIFPQQLCQTDKNNKAVATSACMERATLLLQIPPQPLQMPVQQQQQQHWKPSTRQPCNRSSLLRPICWVVGIISRRRLRPSQPKQQAVRPPCDVHCPPAARHTSSLPPPAEYSCLALLPSSKGRIFTVKSLLFNALGATISVG